MIGGMKNYIKWLNSSGNSLLSDDGLSHSVESTLVGAASSVDDGGVLKTSVMAAFAIVSSSLELLLLGVLTDLIDFIPLSSFYKKVIK